MSALHSVVYASTATQPMTTIELEDLLNDARAFNLAHGVTGVLLCSGSSFMQCFEGAPEDTRLVYDRIKRSSKHQDIVEYLDDPIAERAFGSWEMGLVQPTESELLKLSTEEWSKSTRDGFSPGSPRGLELLKMFWQVHQPSA